MTQTNIRYRAYDYKSHFLQSYNGLLEGAPYWAKACAVRFGGYVTKVNEINGLDFGEPEIIYDFRKKNNSITP